jgi:sterol carrier protein 2
LVKNSRDACSCSTGSSALYLARQAVASGQFECALALGFEKMAAGSLSSGWTDRTNPIDNIIKINAELRGLDTSAPLTPQIFANAGSEYLEKNGGPDDVFHLIAEKSHNHSTLNPYAQFQQPASFEQVKTARKIFGPLTLLHCSPTSDGAGCAILANEAFVVKHGLGTQAVEIAGQSLVTDSVLAFDPERKQKSCLQAAGFDMTKKAASDVYRQAGILPKEVDVVELHDCFSPNELITYDALGLCEPGKAADFIMSGAATLPAFYKGSKQPLKRTIVNPSGGLISKGHPLGATGLAQCAELNWQIRYYFFQYYFFILININRGMAGKRQVTGVRYALQHNIGLGGAVVVTLYKKATLPASPTTFKDSVSRFGYNPAIEARPVTSQMIQSVLSKKGSLLGTPNQLDCLFLEKLNSKL